MKKSWIISLLLLAVSIHASDATGKTTIALGKFRMGVIQGINRMGDRSLANLENALYSNVRASLFKTNKFEFLERKNLDEIMTEISHQYDTGLFDPDSSTEWGVLKGAKHMVMGTIVQFGEESRGNRVGGLFGKKRSVLTMNVELRIVDVKSGKLMHLEMIDASRTLAQDFDMGFLRTPQAGKTLGSDANVVAAGSQYGSSAGNITVLIDLMQEVANKCVREIVLISHPIKIMRVNQEAMFLNYGDEILSEGDLLEICGEGEPMIDPDTGQVLAIEPIRLGFAEVIEANRVYSKAKITSGDLMMLADRDDIFCRPFGAKESSGSKRRRGGKGWNPFRKKKKP